MSAFSRTTFDTVRYAAARPTYPRTLTDLVLAFHARGPPALAGLLPQSLGSSDSKSGKIKALRTYEELEDVVREEGRAIVASITSSSGIYDNLDGAQAGPKWETAVDLGCGTGASSILSEKSKL